MKKEQKILLVLCAMVCNRKWPLCVCLCLCVCFTRKCKNKMILTDIQINTFD